MVISITVLLLFVVSCDLFDPENNDPPINMSIDNDSIPDWYPSQLTYSSERSEEYSSILDSFKTTYDISSFGLTSNSLLSNIQQLHSNPFSVCEFSASEDTLITYRKAMDDFVLNWWRLLCMEPFEIDSVKAFLNGRFYPKSHYELPVYNPIPYLGSVRFYVNTDGELSYLTSSLVPQLPVPKNPMLDLDSTTAILEDYTFTINRWPHMVEYSLNPNDITSTGLEIYIPKTYNNESETYTEVTFRLVWRISIHDGDLLVDALSGEILGFIQTVIYG